MIQKCFNINPQIVALEVKSGRIKKLPKVELLSKKGIDCPLKVISNENIDQFLSTLSVEKIVEL